MGMFVVGQDYYIVTNEGGDLSTSVWTVSEIEMPLIKLTSRHHGKNRIVNTSSASFVRAEEIEYDPEAEAAWDDLLD